MKNNLLKDYIINKKRGTVLFLAIIIASVTLIVGFGISTIAMKELILASFNQESTKAFFAADSALECVAYQDLEVSTQANMIFPEPPVSVNNTPTDYEAYYTFDGDVTDLTGSHNGTIVGTPSFVSGKINGSILLDAVGDYVDTNILWQVSDTEITLSVWVKTTDTIGNIISSYPGFNPSDFFSINLMERGVPNPPGEVGFQVRDESGNIMQIFTGISISDGEWHHLVLVVEGTVLKSYIDNISTGTTSYSLFTGNMSTPLSILIGEDPDPYNAGSRHLVGQVDDIRIYKRPLNDLEIESLYDFGSTTTLQNPPPTPKEFVCMGDTVTPGNTVDAYTTVINPAGNGYETKFTVKKDLDTNKACAIVTVDKTPVGSTKIRTTITSQGSNTCNPNSNRRIQRGIKWWYEESQLPAF